MEIHKLYAAHYNELTAYAFTLTKERGAAEDIVQETFLRALAQAGEERPVNRAWLYKTARNLFIDQCRRRSRETLPEEGALESIPFEQDLTGPAAAQMIGLLPPSERTLFILRHFEGYNASELGEMFSLPSSTVRARLASARRRLRDALAR